MIRELPEALDRLCAHFDAELERQRAVLAATMTQGEAARSRDLEALQEATKALLVLMEQALEAERERLTLVHLIVTGFALNEPHQTLSGLIERAPEPWSSRMGVFQTEIREVLRETQEHVRKDSNYLRRSGRILERSVRSVLGQPEQAGDAYDKEGNEPDGALRAPALVNTLG